MPSPLCKFIHNSENLPELCTNVQVVRVGIRHAERSREMVLSNTSLDKNFLCVVELTTGYCQDG